MEKADLKNGMSFETKEGNVYFIIQGNLYRRTEQLILEPSGSFKVHVEDGYYNNLHHKTDCNKNIMKVYDVDGKQIWSRVDWSKVPVDTKVLVRDSDNNKWVRRHYASFDKEKDLFRAFTDGGTSWTTNDTTGWIQCKLDNEEDNKEKLEQKEISAHDLNEEFGEFCQKSFPHCRNCKYDMDNLCKIKWILDTYNLTKK